MRAVKLSKLEMKLVKEHTHLNPILKRALKLCKNTILFKLIT